MRPTILLVGSTGQVGWELQRTLASVGDLVSASICGSFGPKVDLTSEDSVARLFRDVQPQLVVNAAAYTAVDKAEEEEEVARAVNATAVRVLGDLAKAAGAGVVHYSTDFVFAGTSRKPYREQDEPGPLNAYGRTKLEGERALLDSGAAALIFRTSWVYGIRGQNFLLTMQNLMRERAEVNVVDDQVGSPTWARMLAEVTAQILAQVAVEKLELGELRGVYHLTAAGKTSWYGFARAIWEAAGSPCRLKPINTSAYPAPAKRPTYSVLDNSRFQATFGLSLPDWRESLLHCLQDQIPG